MIISNQNIHKQSIDVNQSESSRITIVNYLRGTSQLGFPLDSTDSDSFKKVKNMLKIIIHRILLAAAFGMAALSLQACSGGGGTAATVAVPSPTGVSTITAFSQTLSTTKNNPITITLQGESPAAGTLTFDVYTSPVSGTLTGQLAGINPVMTYTPGLDFYGNDAFTFNVTDAQGNTAMGTINIQVLNSISPLADTDGDGLLDLDELNKYGTNPKLADTDADGFDDFQEIVTFGFNANVNNYRFNPLIADTPQVDVRMVSVPDIRINYTQTDGTSSQVSTTRSQTSSQSVSTSQSESESTTVSDAHSVGGSISTTASVTVEAGLFDPPKASGTVSTTAEANYNYEHTTTNEQSTSWSQTQTQENSKTFSESESFEKNHSIAASDGEISLAVEITNKGSITYTLNNLFLSATYLRPRGANPLVPVGNLGFDTTGGGFPATTLAPGQSTGTLTFKASGVNLQKIKEILRDSQGFSVRPTLYNLLDANNVSYNFSSTGITSTDAMVLVDYNGNAGLSNIRKMVAVRGNPNTSITMADALNKVLKVQMSTDGYSYINTVSGISNNDPYSTWVIVHGKQIGNAQMQTTIYTTPADEARWKARNPQVTNLVSSYDPTSIQLSGGDVLHVVYLQDNDLDGLSNRLEFFHRTDPSNPDTDGDGLKDGFEVRDGWKIAYQDRNGADVYTQVYPSPVLVDTDGDQVDDYAEVNFAGVNDWYSRNPSNPDTDGDGLDDSIDDRTYLNPGFGALLVNQYDDLAISMLDAYADLANPGAVTLAGQTPYDVYASYQLPAILMTPNPAAEGLTGYEVITIRYNDISGTGSFPDPVALSNGRPYLVGDQVNCAPGASTPCTWEVVDVYRPATDGTLTSRVHRFADTSQILSESTSGTPPAEVFKYIQFVNVNGIYTRQSQEKTVSPATEVLELHMLGADMTNARTLWATIWAPAYETFTTYFSWANGGKYTHWLNHGGNAFYAYDVATGKYIGDYTMPDMHGGGIIKLWWELGVDGQSLTHLPVPYVIHGSYANSWRDGPVNLYDVYTYDHARNPVYVPGTINTPSMKMFYYDYDPATAADVAVPVDPYTGGAVYKLTVPAVPGCHTVQFSARSFDEKQNRYNNGQARLASDSANFDKMELCRDAFGVWSASNVIASDQASPLKRNVLGYFPNGATQTTKNNRFPIEYVSDIMQWGKDSTKEFDLQIRYKVFVR